MTGVPPEALLATGTITVLPDRSTLSEKTAPAGLAVMIELSDDSPVIALPSTASMTSPARSTLLAG